MLTAPSKHSCAEANVNELNRVTTRTAPYRTAPAHVAGHRYIHTYKQTNAIRQCSGIRCLTLRHSVIKLNIYRTFQNPMYTEVTQTQQSSNRDKHNMTGAPTYATVSKASKRRTDGNKHNQGMLIHDNNEANKHLML